MDRNWVEQYKKKNSYHILSKPDQRVIDRLIDEELKRMSETTKIQPSREGEELIKNWNSYNTRVNRLLKDLDKAREEEAVAAKKVADWLKPSDAKTDETFHMWFGDSMISVTNDSVKLRLRGKSLV